MSNKTYHTKKDILLRGREIIGIPLREIDKTNRLRTGKGAIGNIIEESWFGYSINNESSADFENAGVELKVTPYVRTSRGIRAKERLVCNIIDYMKEYKSDFSSSSFWKKCKTMLLMFYEHKDGIDKGDVTIDEVILFSFPSKDLMIIKRDWETIIAKIKCGKAHEISEGDTLYLGACTKGASSSTVRAQPFSDIPARQRAYSLKQSYMTYILNKYVFGNSVDEHIIKNPKLLRQKSFEEYILSKVRPFLGRTQKSLAQEFSLNINAKNINELILSRIFGVKGRISSTEEFQKASIVPKTIRVNTDGSITESMSFPAFIPNKLIFEEWDTSEFKQYLEQTKFLFVIFKFADNGSLVLENLMFWNIPQADLDEVGIVWKKTVDVLKSGVVFKQRGQRTFNNFPKASENNVAHVRPHARNKNDTFVLPDGRMMPKHCFWLNNTYIQKQIEAR